jgi:hypothetical protein
MSMVVIALGAKALLRRADPRTVAATPEGR